MELFLERVNETMDLKMNELKEEFMKQTSSLASNMANIIDQKLNPLLEENAQLKNEVMTLKNKVGNLEKEMRRNNILLHGLKETESNSNELMNLVVQFLNNIGNKCGIREFDMWELNQVQRLGKKVDNKHRPILVKFTLAWRKVEILKNGKYFPATTYATEDFPKEVLQIRKELKIQQHEEKKKGNFAVIRYDKLVIKGKIKQGSAKEKRKRAPSNTSPQSNNDVSPTPKVPSKIIKVNAFELMNKTRQTTQTETNNQ